MPSGAEERANGTPRASHVSSQTNATLSPTWAPPKSPLPPHRLAKLANALGVSTPIPLSKSPTQYLSRSFSESSNSPIDLRRSPTPSATASSMGFSSYPPSNSKFLLHVIPPNHLPHDSENPDENSFLPPPPNTPGYHTQFRRSPSPYQMEMEEPGPRLSEDIWRHLWTRVLSAEQRDDLLMPSLSPRSTTSAMSPRNPNIFGFAPAARSTPFLPQESAEPDTPDTSIEDPGVRLDLPGLHSPSLIPILAKVEFDIDRRKAPWYEPWLRSRKANHAKRSESRKNSRSQSGGAGGEDEPREHVPVEFLTGKKNKTDPFGLSLTPSEDKEEENGYARLSESPQEIDSDSDSEAEEFSEDATAKVSSMTGGKDPLDDVFGTDTDTWADIHAENRRQHKYSNPNIVNLALTAEELDALPSPSNLEDDKESTKEEDEVMEMLDIMGKPQLAMAIPSPAKNKRSSSPTSASSRKIPPPLVLKPKDKSGTTVISSHASPRPRTSDSNLAYLGEQSDRDEDGNLVIDRVRSPDADKRVGAVFDDLDLGLDPTEDFDDDDPNDRRRNDGSTFSPYIKDRFRRGAEYELLHDPFSGDFTGQSWPAVPFSVIKDKGPESNPNAPPSPPRLAVNGVTTSAPRSYQPTHAPSNGPSESERRKKLEEEEGSLYPPNVIPAKLQSSSPASPIIPLSPDPFGRHPSSPEPPQTLQMTGPQWDTMTIGKGVVPEMVSEPPVKGRARSGTSGTTSRFSADSLNGEEVVSTKSQNRGTLMSVKSIRKLWRKSSNKSTSASRTSPMVPPQRPERPSEEQLLDLPDIPDMPPMVPPVPRTSQEQLAPGRRPSVDQPMGPPPANIGRTSPQTIPPRRDSIPQGRRPSVDLLGAPPQPQQFQQLSVPAYPGRNPNPVPITTPYMQAAKASSSLNSLHFDQESPYPVRPMRQSPRPPSPPPLPAIPEQEKPVALLNGRVGILEGADQV
ncbi:hypothetical protein CPB84DRAFT_1743540 [Gymnopilus junonius]|uniref:Uncharacterized protein n=1 Tax=Gymnopilus junonius TaxID=109634 RepID=A0A9P5TTP0_GYMJU|nr:hypothetical protein CPB84DRAFT_1743540 [Gymnopilus junonius]